MKIDENSINDILGFEIDSRIADYIDNSKFEYSFLDKDERDKYILNVVDVLTSKIIKSGKHRIFQWENGWKENLELYKKTKDLYSLIPKYHCKYDFFRWKGDIVKSITKNLDYKLHLCLVDSILNHYIGDNKNVFEFGCGPAYHLIRLQEYNKELNLYGLDWATSSQEIIKEINKNLNINIKGINFNFFEPDYNVDIPENSVFYTVAALEQLGKNFGPFLDFILNKKPKICINMEPIDELLDETNLIDNLSIKYFRKRNYLKGYLPYLEKLEKENKIEIIKKQRLFYGSYFVEGHSLIVWKPKNQFEK